MEVICFMLVCGWSKI